MKSIAQRIEEKTQLIEEKAVITERSLNILRFTRKDLSGFQKIELSMEIDYKLAWLIESIAHKWVNSHRDLVDKKKSEKIALQSVLRALLENPDFSDMKKAIDEEIRKNPENVYLFPKTFLVRLTVKEMQEILGREISLYDAIELVEKLQKLTIKGEGKLLWNPVTKKTELKKFCGVISPLTNTIFYRDIDGTWCKKWRFPLGEFVFCFQTYWGIIFLLNLINRTWLLKPQGVYSLSSSFAQNIYNFVYMQPKDEVKCGIRKLALIAGCQQKAYHNIKYELKRALNLLVEEAYLEKDWRTEGQAWDTIYILKKSKLIKLIPQTSQNNRNSHYQNKCDFMQNNRNSHYGMTEIAIISKAENNRNSHGSTPYDLVKNHVLDTRRINLFK